MSLEAHWEHVYKSRSAQEMSWYEAHLSTSLEWISEAASGAASSIVDVGGGASTLAGDLYAKGFRALTVLDLSPTAIALSRERMGSAAGTIRWIVGDVTRCPLCGDSFDIWHDRAVFHFLTQQRDRDAYMECLSRALRPEGQVVIATFSRNGPLSCSGLDVTCYDEELMERQFGADFRITKSATVVHQTPSGKPQEFLYCRIARRRHR